MTVIRTWKNDGSRNVFRDARYAIANLHRNWPGPVKPSGDEIASRLQCGEILETEYALFHDPSIVTDGEVARRRAQAQQRMKGGPYVA